MKTIKYLSVLFLSLLISTACEEDDHEFGAIITPTSLDVNAEIIGLDADNPYGNGDGFVSFTATADNALAYQFEFGDGNSTTNSSGIYTHRYTQVGVNSYTIIVLSLIHI